MPAVILNLAARWLFLPKLLMVMMISSGLTLVSNNSYADSLEITPLWFGRFVIADNSTVSTLTIRHDGRNPIARNRIHPIEFGTAGEYQLFNFPAYTPLAITITGNNLSTAGPTEEFTIGDFTFDDVTTDADGQATLVVGATLSTSGNGTNYVSAEYSAIYNIVINY